MSDRRAYVRALLRQDLKTFATRSFRTLEPGTPFISSWHIDHLAWKLTQVATGEVRRLIVNMPPRYMKSLLASVAFPAWVLGRNPTQRILCLSHTRQLARTHARSFRSVVEADWCRWAFPSAYGQGLRLQDFEARTRDRGYRMASAVTGSVLGVGADLIILDDPMRGEAMYSEAERRRVNELFDGTISTRLNNKQTGAIVIIMQRLHADDLVGHVLEQEDWEVVSIPVRATEPRAYSYGPSPNQVYNRLEGELLQPKREGEAELAVMRRRLGSLGFSAQYQQQPIPPDGAVIKRDWIRYYETPPAKLDLVICSWDTRLPWPSPCPPRADPAARPRRGPAAIPAQCRPRLEAAFDWTSSAKEAWFLVPRPQEGP